MKHKKIVRWRIYLIIALVLIYTPTFVRSIALMRYSSSPKLAVQNYLGTKKTVEVATITGKEGIVYISLHHNEIAAYNFDTKTKGGNIWYKAAKERKLVTIENSLVKMNTAPKSTEQIVFGAGEGFSKDCSEKTGINAEFIRFEWRERGRPYTIWYIISADGLDELPDLQLDGSEFNNPPSWVDHIIVYGFLGVSLLSGGIIFFTFMVPKGSKKNKA